jgi:hypothetical protein
MSAKLVIENRAFRLEVLREGDAVTVYSYRKYSIDGKPEWVRYEGTGFICLVKEDIERLVSFLEHEMFRLPEKNPVK